jgi:hypothetical protein
MASVSSKGAARHEDTERWSPLVYGRTRMVDNWWRALPQARADQWISEMVFAAVAGGRGLTSEGQPRYLLARDATRVLLGVTCAAASLSATMNAEVTGRSLYTLIGWTTSDPSACIPPLTTLREYALSWASAEYERWLAVHWDKPDAPTSSTSAGQAPWQSLAIPPPAIPGNSHPLRRRTGFTLIVPAAQADQLWEAARAARKPVAIVVGWQRWTHADRVILTALSADDADSAMTVRTETGARSAKFRRSNGTDIGTLLRNSISRTRQFTLRERRANK